MALDRKVILSILGCSEGTKIPTANAENRELENQLTELLKRKSDAMVNLCVMSENGKFTKKSLATLKQQRDYNQEFINGLSKQLESEMSQLKDAELSQNQRSKDVKNIKKEMEDTQKHTKTNKDKLKELTGRLMELKESLCWGEDALLEWGAAVARGERELNVLEKYRSLEQEKFLALDKEKKQVEMDLLEAEELEKREEERFKMVSLQLENVFKLTREATKEHERLMSVWKDSMETSNLHEEEEKRLSSILCEVNNNARQKCSELYEEENFYQDLRNSNESLESEITKYKTEARTTKSENEELEKDVKHLKDEVNLRRRDTTNMSGQMESQRIKNSGMEAHNKARREQLLKISNMVKCLKEECTALSMDSNASDITFRNAEEIYEMKKKQMEEEEKEMSRLGVIALELQRERDRIQGTIDRKSREHKLADRVVKSMQTESTRKEEELRLLEQEIFFLTGDERVLVKKIMELRDKCSGKEERDELEKEIRELEEDKGEVLKEHLLLKKRLECLQREYRDKHRNLYNSGAELETLTEIHSSKQVLYNNSRKEIELVQEEQHKTRTQLKLLKMREHCLKTHIVRDDEAVGQLERKRSLLEMAMKERLLEVEALKDVLLGKKRSLLEEKIMRTRQIEHIKSQLKLNQSRYATTLDLLGKDDGGQQLSVAYFKIKLAQEKYELQIECDELEAKILKAETELLAMENTLKWFKATNENFKFGLEVTEEEDKIKIEKERFDTKYAELKYQLEEESKVLRTLKKDFKALLDEIAYLKNKEQQLQEESNGKNYELILIEKDNFSKRERLQRATNILSKLLRDIRRLKESPKYKELAQKEINVKMEEDRNRSALQQLTNLSSLSGEIKAFIDDYYQRSCLSSVKRSSFSRYSDVFKPHSRFDEPKSRVSTASSASSSEVSIINLNPAELFPDAKPTCLKRRR